MFRQIRSLIGNLLTEINQINCVDEVKFSFVYFDLYRPKPDAINFLQNRIQKGCIPPYDDELINQTRVNKSVYDSWINLDNSITTSSGTLTFFS